MSVAELQELEEVRVLVAKGRQTGVLTYAEVATALAEVELDEGDIEELHGYFEKSEIELVEDDPTASEPQVERAVDRRSRRKKASIDLKPDMTTDSLQLFLKDIGKVRLLTAQEEVDLAKRIERGDLVEKLNKIGRAERKLVTELGREPTPEEIAEHTGIEPEEVESIKRSAQAPVSLEKPVGDEEESEFGQFIADERAESPFERAAELLTKEALKEALENLSYRERRVLELRYGLGGEHPRTLDEVGRTFNVTRERIRQIENQSLKKLQSLAEAQKLREVA